MDGEDEFEWVDPATLEDATTDELVDHIVTLQDRMQGLETELQGLQEMVLLLLDIQAGVAAETHPELVALIRDDANIAAEDTE